MTPKIWGSLGQRMGERKARAYKKKLDLVYHQMSPEDVLALLERDPDGPVIESLARRPDSTIALAVALHDKATPEALRSLSIHRLGSVREAVAGHPNTPVEILIRFITNMDVAAGHIALEHPELPVEWLQRGLKGPIPWMRAAASSPNLPEIWAMELAQAAPESVLVSLVRNPKTTKEVLGAILERTKESGEMEGRYNIRAEIAKLAALDLNLERALAEDEHPEVTRAILDKTLEEEVDIGAVVAVARQDLDLYEKEPTKELETRLHRALTFLESQAADGSEPAALVAWVIWIRYAPLKATVIYPRLSAHRRQILGPQALEPLLNHAEEIIRERAKPLVVLSR